jgi:hypothetical protein
MLGQKHFFNNIYLNKQQPFHIEGKYFYFPLELCLFSHHKAFEHDLPTAVMSGVLSPNMINLGK